MVKGDPAIVAGTKILLLFAMLLLFIVTDCVVDALILFI